MKKIIAYHIVYYAKTQSPIKLPKMLYKECKLFEYDYHCLLN